MRTRPGDTRLPCRRGKPAYTYLPSAAAVVTLRSRFGIHLASEHLRRTGGAQPGIASIMDQEDIMAHTLPPLPYPNNALEPSIDALTMEIHHDRHHKAYVDNLNKALEGHAELAKKPVEQLLREINQVPENTRTAVRNNGGGHA